MKKKIIGIFVCMLLITTAIPIVSSVPERGLSLSDNISINKKSGCNKYYFFEREKIKELDNPSPKPTIIDDLPDYFSWKDYNGEDWTTPAKDQGNCGSCWLCAALGALESVIKIREGSAPLAIDLSEQYVLSCLKIAGSCRGGWAYKAFKYIMRNTSSGNNCNGIIPEFCFPYTAIDGNGCKFDNCDYDPVECDEKCEDWEDFLIPISDYGYWVPDGSSEDIDAIKTQVMETGPVVAVMYATYYPHGENNFEEWGWQHSDPDDYYPYPGPIDGGNHQVVIVGWKDDPSIGKGGYWICKNSFSAEWGYDGFLNIEYGSLNIDSVDINWVDYNQESYNNWLPVADANGMYYGNAGKEIIFDASNSFDHEGEISSYYWDFGDGADSTDCISPHTYEESGIYPILLRVVDNEGNIGEDKTWGFIDHTNTAPNKPSLEGPTEIKNGTSYEYTFYATDPDEDDVYYYLNWGDTFWAGWWEGWIGPYKSGEKVILENTWDENGKYTVRVRAKDKYEAKSDWATLKVKTSKNKVVNTNQLFLNFLQQRLNLFPILQKILLLQRFGLQ